MKKMFMIFMAFTMIAGLFAYEPKKECAKVKRNGDVKYYEKTELYHIYGLEPDPKDLCRWYNLYSGNTYDYECWVIRKGYTVEMLVDYEYKRLKSLRDSYFYFISKSIEPDVSNANIAFTDAINAINGTSITPEEYASESSIQLAEQHERTAILSIPFVTEENFLFISKTEMYCKMKAFIEEVKANKR